MKKLSYIIAAAMLSLHGSLQAQDVNADLSEWSVVTSGDLMMVNDIQGLSYVGGNVTVPNSFNVATGSGSIPKTTVSLAVVGNINNGGNLQVNGGSVVAGGTIQRTVNMNSGGTSTANDPAGLPASPIATITSASQFWSTMTANSTTFKNAGGQLVFNCAAGANVAVFDITAQQMFNGGFQGFVLAPTNTTGTVLINIAGSVADWTTGNFASEFNTTAWNSKVLFNFFDATNVTLSGLIGGYVVAPNANVTVGNNIDGGVMAKNLTVDSEIDLPGGTTSPTAWTGTLPNLSPVPEPSTWALIVTGVLVVGSRLRRFSH